MSPADAFVGTYQATWSSIATVTSPSGVPPQSYTDTAVITVTALDDNDILMSWQVGSNAPSGTISFAVTGNSATATGIGTGGTCWMGVLTNGNQQTSCALTATATIYGNTLTQHQTGTATGATSGGVAYTATYDGTWTGIRIQGDSNASSSSGVADTSDFLGTWTGPATTSVVCPSGTYPTSGSGTESITAGSTAGEVTTFGGYCHLNWTVTGDTASLAGSQTCATVTDSSGGTWTPTYTGGAIAVQGTTASISLAGTEVHASTSLPSGTETCTFAAMGSYTN